MKAIIFTYADIMAAAAASAAKEATPDPPEPPKIGRPAGSQAMLFDGLDCLPGQGDLFTEGNG
jgi:hypothetical protein